MKRENLGFPGILVMLSGFSSLWWPFGWNWSYLGFLGIIWRTCGSKCRGEGGGIFPTLCVECCLVHFGRIEHDLFGVFFLIHQHKNDLLSTNPRKIRSFWPQNTIFPSIFLGPIFSGPRHTPSNFRTEYPPRSCSYILICLEWHTVKICLTFPS